MNFIVNSNSNIIINDVEFEILNETHEFPKQIVMINRLPHQIG